MSTNDGFWWLEGHVEVLVAQDDSADRFSILRHTVPHGAAPPWHVHHEEDEVFQVLAGRMRFKKAETVLEAGVGETIFLPRGVPHSFHVISDEGARFLTITRGRFEAMIRAGGIPAAEVSLPEPVEMTPELQARFAEICAAHGIDLIGPPIE